MSREEISSKNNDFDSQIVVKFAQFHPCTVKIGNFKAIQRAHIAKIH